LGLGLLSVSLFPVHRLLSDPATGPAGSATITLADATQSLAFWGLAMVLGVALALGRLAGGLDPAGLLGRLDKALSGWSPRVASLLPALIALLLGVTASLALFKGYPTALDEMAHLVQARFMAVGRLAGQGAVPPEAWVIQNTMISGSGWSSQYPPLHTAILSLGMRAGVAWVVGPVITMALVMFTALIGCALFVAPPLQSAARSVREAGIPITGKVVSDEYVHPAELDEHLVHWLD
jgi:hypothetical protein